MDQKISKQIYSHKFCLISRVESMTHQSLMKAPCADVMFTEVKIVQLRFDGQMPHQHTCTCDKEPSDQVMTVSAEPEVQSMINCYKPFRQSWKWSQVQTEGTVRYLVLIQSIFETKSNSIPQMLIDYYVSSIAYSGHILLLTCKIHKKGQTNLGKFQSK